jgi:hypothetical protein
MCARSLHFNEEFVVIVFMSCALSCRAYTVLDQAPAAAFKPPAQPPSTFLQQQQQDADLLEQDKEASVQVGCRRWLV